MDEELEYIIELLGPQNEEIDDDIVDSLEEEIATLDPELLYELTLAVIRLGKYQILDIILSNNECTKKQIKSFKKELENYVNDDDDDDDDDEISDIGSKMEIIISNCEEDPVRWMKSVKI